MSALRPMDATLAGYPWLPRMIDKARARRAGTLGDHVHPCPVDRACLARLRVGFEEFTALIGATSTDAEVLDGLRALGAATPAQAWFDPVQREEELRREDAPHGPQVVAVDRFSGLEHGVIGLSFARAALAPGESRAAHQHPYDEVVLVEEGRLSARCGDDELEVEAGDSLTLPAGTAHALANRGEVPVRFLELHANGRVIESPALAGTSAI